VACYAENNLPVVGKVKMAEGREMGWLRVNRYWKPERAEDGSVIKEQAYFVPMMCQHCAHAPCESVCPVLATYHTLDGLNAMVYNRCVGTRYCSNACPYSVRRFNYHSYQWPEPFNLMLNPDVSTRTMGVMEKCTYCVQRIRRSKIAWKDQGHTDLLPDDQLVKLTACADACPSSAIAFGNLLDPNSTVSRARRSGRTYYPIFEINTMPAANYLARASHHREAAAHHGGTHGGTGGGHGEAHGDEGREINDPASQEPKANDHAPAPAPAGH
jgi:Fe-S-cluster-containing dehydrogenase component